MLTLMSFNVLFGGEDRFPAILDLLAREMPDVLVLQECLDWEDGDRLSQAAEAIGAPEVFLAKARPRSSGSRYHIAVASRLPIRSSKVHNNPHFIGHCIAEVAIEGGMTLFGCHFDAHHENLRFVEARFVRSLIDPAKFAAGRYVLAGDLNSLSAADPYPAHLAEIHQAAGHIKYGSPPRFDVMGDLFDFGWIDTLRHKPLNGSWVTARRDRNGVMVDYRTDYILASPAMARLLNTAHVIEVGEVSDHNAVLARFDVPAAGNEPESAAHLNPTTIGRAVT